MIYNNLDRIEDWGFDIDVLRHHYYYMKQFTK